MDNKIISIRVPKALLKRMSEYREKEGVSVSYQLCNGAELYLASKAKKK